jgi:hypothetical protein
MASQIMGIGLLDHIVVGKYGYYSYIENDKLPDEFGIDELVKFAKEYE